MYSLNGDCFLVRGETLQLWFKWCVALAFIPKRHIQDMFADKILDEAPVDIYPSLNKFYRIKLDFCFILYQYIT